MVEHCPPGLCQRSTGAGNCLSSNLWGCSNKVYPIFYIINFAPMFCRSRIKRLCLYLMPNRDLTSHILILYNSLGSPGRDFLIQVNPAPNSIERRTSVSSISGYLDSTGQSQTECQLASTFSLVSGLLSSSGERITASENVSWKRFSVSNNQGLASIFAVALDGTIYWKSDAFANETARFGTFRNGTFYAVFSEAWPNNMTQATLIAVDGMSLNITNLTRGIEHGADKTFLVLSCGLSRPAAIEFKHSYIDLVCQYFVLDINASLNTEYVDKDVIN